MIQWFPHYTWIQDRPKHYLQRKWRTYVHHYWGLPGEFYPALMIEKPRDLTQLCISNLIVTFSGRISQLTVPWNKRRQGQGKTVKWSVARIATKRWRIRRKRPAIFTLHPHTSVLVCSLTKCIASQRETLQNLPIFFGFGRRICNTRTSNQMKKSGESNISEF